MSICRSLQLLNAADVYPRSRGCLPCFWVILPWKEARSWIPQKEQSLQTFCFLPRLLSSTGMVYPWRRNILQLFFWTCFLPMPPLFFPACTLAAANLWNLHGVVNERTGAFPQLQSHLPSDCIDLRCLTNYEGKHQNLGCPHNLFIILGSDCLVSAIEHIGGQFCRPGSGATARVLLLTFAFSLRQVFEMQRKWREFAPLLGFIFLLGSQSCVIFLSYFSATVLHRPYFSSLGVTLKIFS